jgi:hypothetical protein
MQDIHKQCIGSDDVQVLLRNKNKTIVINTLPIHEQNILIKDTIPIATEESLINHLIYTKNKLYHVIIIYGKNHTDASVYVKYKQFIKLGFHSSILYIYTGGLYEWLLLHKYENNTIYLLNNIYVEDCIELYKPISILSHKSI